MRNLLCVTGVLLAIAANTGCSGDDTGAATEGAGGSSSATSTSKAASTGEGGAGGTGSSAGGAGGGGGKGAYGTDCAADADCESGVCGSFMMGAAHLCSLACTSDADCPNGDKCSGMGQCNPLM